jgi:hypothetical protein
MMKLLRGRNLAHPGCLIGIILGLIIGITLAGILAVTTQLSYLVVTMVWFGLIFICGLIGWIAGAKLTSKFPPLEEPSTTMTSVQADRDR